MHGYRTALFSFLLISTLSLFSHADAAIETSLNKVKELASKRSPELRIADSELKQRKAGVYSAWSRWAPRVDLSLSQSRSRDYSIINSGSLGSLSSVVTPSAVDQRRWSLDLTFPIFRRSVWVGVQEASAMKELTYYQSLGKMREFDWKMRQLYGTYLVQLYKVSALKTSIELAQNNFKEAKLRFELGDRTKVDVLRAESNLASLESRLIDSQAAREQSLNSFLEYSGLTQNELIDAGLPLTADNEKILRALFQEFISSDKAFEKVEPFLPQSEKEDANQTSFQKRVTENSPDYLAALAQEDLRTAQSRQLSSDQWPELLAQGSLNKQAADWGTAFAGGTRSYSFALVLNIPIFTGTRLVSSHIEHVQAARVGELQRERQITQLLNQLENDRWKARSLKRSIESQRLNLSRNEEIVRLTLKSYQLGKSSLSDLLLSENDLYDTKTALAQNELELMNLLRKLSWNLGLEDT